MLSELIAADDISALFTATMHEGVLLLAADPTSLMLCAICYRQLNVTNFRLTFNGYIKTALVHWSLVGGLLNLVQRGGTWALRLFYNSPPISGQCTNFILFNTAL